MGCVLSWFCSIALLQRLIDKLKVAPAVVLSTADATAQGIFEKKKKLAKTVVDLIKAVDGRIAVLACLPVLPTYRV